MMSTSYRFATLSIGQAIVNNACLRHFHKDEVRKTLDSEDQHTSKLQVVCPRNNIKNGAKRRLHASYEVYIAVLVVQADFL